MSKIYYLLDESGSMFVRRDKVLNGMTEFLQDQRRLTEKCEISIYSFNDSIRVLMEDCDIATIGEDFSIESYNPHSCTALLDAMGFVLEKIPSDTDGSIKYIIIVLSDGEENSSHQYTKSQIKALLEKKKHVNVIYVGSNQDAILHGGQMGATVESTLAYDDNFLENAMRCTSRALRRYQTNDTPTILYTELERQHSLGKTTVLN